jgi:opacity protein-like surface antigen
MCKRLHLILLLLVVVPSVRAQETPLYEGFFGPSYGREDITNFKFITGFGWHGSIDGTATNWLTAVFDFSGYYSSPKIQIDGLPSFPANTSTYLYLFGPRFTLRKWDRVTPFAEALFGPATFKFTASSVGITNPVSSTAFAAALGGGVDYAVNSRFAVRVFELDYVPTRFHELGINPVTGQVSFSGPSRTQNNVRVSVGVVFKFGTR